MKRIFLVFSLSLVLAACCKNGYGEVLGKEYSGTVKLKVTDYSGVQRVDWPVTSGIPFPKGVIKDERHIALFDSQGKEIPLQTSILSRYWEADNSIRWVLLDFNANVAANGTSYYIVKYGDEIHRHQFPTELKVKKEGEEVSINTGALKFKVGQDFLSDVQMKTKEGWKEVSGSKGGNMTMDITAPPDMNLPAVVLGKGRNEGHYSSRLTKDVEIKIEDNGPLRVQVKVRGLYRREDGREFGPFTLRVNAYSGKSYLRIYHTFVNSDLPERGLIKDVGIEFPLTMNGEAKITYGTSPISSTKAADDKSYYLLQDKWNSYETNEGKEEKKYYGQSEGWLDVSGKGIGITAMFRNCAQLFPKEIKYQNNELEIFPYPEDEVGPLDLRREEEKHTPGWEQFKKDYPAGYAQYNAGVVKAYQKALDDGNLYYLMNHSALGFSRTHEIYLYFHGSKNNSEDIKHLTKSFEKPLTAFALNHWYDYTNTLGHFGWKDTINFLLVENYFDKKVDWAIKNQNEWFQDHFWGIVNYGGMQALLMTDSSSLGPANDWTWYLGLRGWVNDEIDAPKELLLYYLRSGDYRTFLFTQSAVNQMMDVVTAHANLSDFEPVKTVPNWKVGGMNRHEYDPYGGGVLENHTWNEGLIDYYYLTGYKRAYDVALETGQFALRLYGNANRIKQWQLYEKQFDRNSSNNWRLLLKCYELTGQKKFKVEAIKWRKFYLKHSPYSYRSLGQSTFMTVSYLMPTYALDYRLFRDDSTVQEIMNIAKWITTIMVDVEKSKITHTEPVLPGNIKLTGSWDPYKQGFLAPALAFDITRGGGPLEDLIKVWVRERLSPYGRNSSVGTSVSDFTEMRWDEFEPLFDFLQACKDMKLTETGKSWH